MSGVQLQEALISYDPLVPFRRIRRTIIMRRAAQLDCGICWHGTDSNIAARSREETRCALARRKEVKDEDLSPCLDKGPSTQSAEVIVKLYGGFNFVITEPFQWQRDRG